jgi:hypothetical protein
MSRPFDQKLMDEFYLHVERDLKICLSPKYCQTKDSFLESAHFDSVYFTYDLIDNIKYSTNFDKNRLFCLKLLCHENNFKYVFMNYFDDSSNRNISIEVSLDVYDNFTGTEF